VTFAAAAVCGAAPAIQATQPDLNVELKDGAASTSPVARRFRHTLIVGQLALALVLLACAGLLIKTVVRTFRIDAGYDTTKVVAGDLNLEGPAFASAGAIRSVATSILERLHARPGVKAAFSETVFFRGFGADARQMTVEGLPPLAGDASPTFYFRVTEGYFPIVNQPVIRGRAFTRLDGDVAIINATLARRVWGERDPLGTRIRFGDADSGAPWLTVIGVVADAGGGPLAADHGRPVAYTSFWAHPGREFALYAADPRSAAQLIPEVRAAVAAANRDLPIEDLMTMAQAHAAWAAPARFMAALMTSLSAVALLLASIGIYGAMAYGIGRRTREIGVRLALGATPLQVRLLVARTGVRLVALGLVFGVAGSWAATRMLAGVLAGTSPTDPAVFASVAALLGAIGCLASWLPSRRAARVDPLTVLRQV
jgi:predicted permease